MITKPKVTSVATNEDTVGGGIAESLLAIARTLQEKKLTVMGMMGLREELPSYSTRRIKARKEDVIATLPKLF